MKKIKFYFIIGYIILNAFSPMLAYGNNKATKLYVSKNINLNDIHNNYFSSLNEAVSKIKPNEKTIIYIDAGEYFLDETIRLKGIKDEVIITSKAKEKPKIYGGKRIENWKKEERYFVADCNYEDMRILQVNGRMAQRSRLPGEGTFQHLSQFKSEWLSTLEGGFSPQPTDSQLYHMTYRKEDLDGVKDICDAEITLYHMWDETLVRVEEVDEENGIIRFKNAPAYPAGAFGISKYVVWNTREGMTDPGQWYYDRKNQKLYYWPLEGESTSAIEVIVPCLDTLISISESNNITFSNLEFRVNNSPLKVGGFGAKWFAGAITFDGCKNLKFKNLSFSNLSTMALKGTDSDSILISHNNIVNTGAGGIRLIGSNNKIIENRIFHTGKVYPSAIALYVNVTDPNAIEEWQSGKEEGNVTIDHNEIRDAPYVAIACGGHDTKITNNKISKVMQVLSDGGGIYVTFCKNLKLIGNYVHDIPIQGGYGTCAYYLDELTSNALVKNNLSVNVARAMHNHLSENNTIENNVFINNTGGLRITFHRCQDFNLTNNIFLAKDSLEIKGLNVITTGKSNFLYSTDGGKIFGSKVLAYEKLSEEPINSNLLYILNDPKIISTRNGKVLFSPDSPVLQKGISQIDVSTAGVLD